ncbi:MAG: hypothetical protein JW994_05730 [Candidatus Omnitrophica bacterium]|nr:hypothetical protein [Candidatus Omnitrophota bacterium]
MSKILLFLIKPCLLIAFFVFLSGCCRLEHLVDYVEGIYVNQPAEGTGGRYIRVFDSPRDVCYDKVLDILKEIKVQVRHKSTKEKSILAWYFNNIYGNCIDTTKVSIFFKELTPGKTQVDVACGNYDLAKFASDEIFSRLEKQLSNGK